MHPAAATPLHGSTTTLGRAVRHVLGAGVAAGALTMAYGAGVELRSFRLRTVELPVLGPGARPLRVLHVSDLHLRPAQLAKRRWVRALDRLEPDLVVSTGDHLAHRQAVPALIDALGPLLERPGAFVLGNNDYFSPRLKNPVRYLLPDRGRRPTAGFLPWEDLRTGLTAAGWADLDNARQRVRAGSREVELVGVDDPHLGRDRYDAVAGPPDPTADLTVGVLHAPYRRVLDRMAADRLPLILAGHTHGGQLRVPGYGALVTNCDLPRRQARGLSSWPPATDGAGPGSWLHVSAGLGTSPYAPVRLACPPEATLLTLVPRA